MRSTSLILLIGLVISSCNSLVPREFDFTPVLLHVDKYKQHDSIGFNIATAIPELLYSRIISGDVAIWNSPTKQVKLAKEDILKMEKTAVEPFVKSKNFFIHEVWQIFKRKFDYGILGFSFTGERKDGSKINYGYVDAADVFVLMKEAIIPCNANGSAELTYWEALESMTFDFNIVQFGDMDFKESGSAAFSFELKNKVLYDKGTITHFYEIPEVKEIEYRVVNPKIIKNQENESLYTAISRFINDNKQAILNAGGDRFLNHLSPAEWEIQQIMVVETWRKRDKLPFQELKSLNLVIQQEMIELDLEEIRKLNIKVNLQGIEEYLSEKNFAFVLQRVNNEEITAFQSQQYYDGLIHRDWNKIKR